MIDIWREEVIQIEKGLKGSTGVSPIINNGALIEYRSEPHKGKVTIKMTDYTLDVQEVFLYFLEAINPDFDDDLLFDSIDLIF